jgi:hypothetical protein
VERWLALLKMVFVGVRNAVHVLMAYEVLKNI